MDEKTHEQSDRRLGLSIAQIAGAALAAGSSAFVASTLGVAGTIIGAVVGSVVATVASATYTRSLRRSTTVVRQYSAQLRERTTLNSPVPDPNAPQPVDAPVPDPDAPEPVAEEAADATAVLPATPSVTTKVTTEESARGRLPWAKLAAVSAAVLVVTLGGITVLEAVIGEPLSAVVGGNDKSGTTLGNVRDSDSRPTRPRPVPTPAVTVTPTPTPEPTAGPTDGPTEDPTEGPTDEPTTPAPTPTATPTEPQEPATPPATPAP